MLIIYKCNYKKNQKYMSAVKVMNKLEEGDTFLLVTDGCIRETLRFLNVYEKVLTDSVRM